jgi:hypothetical protein
VPVDRTRDGWEREPARHGGRAIDWHIPLGSLPRLLRRSAGDFPRHSGYLAADPARIEYWRGRLAALGPGTKLGLSWRGGTVRTGWHRRSIALKQLAPLFASAGAHWVSLQYTDCGREISEFSASTGNVLNHWQEAIDDYDETAALVCALDGVVSVCTSLVHLAGALDRPVWVMAPAVPEWRYGIAGEEIPWYPSVRVLRQREPGEWDDVVAETAARIAQAGRSRK